MESIAQTRPKSVFYAVCLLCAAGMIDALAVYLRGGVLAGPYIGFVTLVVLSFAMMRGHAWARGIVFVWCALKFMATLGEALFAFADGHPRVPLGIVSTALFIVACELLFRRPAFMWFSEASSERYRKRIAGPKGSRMSGQQPGEE